MRLRHQYLIAGVVWALLLGPLAAVQLFSFAAGVSWLWLFGDNAWPHATKLLLPLIGLMGGVIAVLACVIGALAYGRHREMQASSNVRSERRKVELLIIAPVAIIALLGTKIWSEWSNYSRAMTVAAQREAEFVTLLAARHEIAGLSVSRSADGELRATVKLVGQRAGSYRLRWQVAGTNYRAVVESGERTLHLRPGSQEVELLFTVEELARSYRTKVLSGAGGVEVDEPFRLELSLVPILSEIERRELPPGERHRLDFGDTSLRVRQSVEFPVRFIIHADGTIEL